MVKHSIALFVLLASAVFAQQPVSDAKQIVSKENSDLRLLAPEKLIGTPKMRGAAWSPDGTQIVVATDLSRPSELWLVRAAGGWPKQLTSTGQQLSSPVWSPDGRWIAVESAASNGTTDLVIVNAESGSVSQLTNTPEVSERSLRWSPDSRQVAFVVQARTGQPELVIQNVLTRTRRAAGNGAPEWARGAASEVAVSAASRDGRVQATISESPLQLVLADTSSKERHIIADDGFVRLAAPEPFSPDGKQLMWFRESAESPQELCLTEVSSRATRQLTNAAIAGIRPGDLVRPVVAPVPGTKLTALVYVPYNQTASAKTPAIVYLRNAAGGPDQFDPLVQYLVNQGYIVAALVASEVQPGDAAATAAWAKTIGVVDPLKLILMGDAHSVTTAMEMPQSPWSAVVALAKAGDNPMNTVAPKVPLLVVGGKEALPKGDSHATVVVHSAAGSVDPLDGSREERVSAAKAIGEFLTKYVPAPGCGCSLE